VSAGSRILAVSGLEALVGPAAARRAQRQELDWAGRPLGEVIDALAARRGGELPGAEDRPLFIFSAGWRSGSTLLQRLVNSSGEYLMWGEPYARSDQVVRLAESLRPISPWWPPDGDFESDHGDSRLADRWTANLHPPLASLVEAHRAFFRTLFAPTGNGNAATRWGFKEVRLAGEYALYLHFLFPRSKFLFLVRDPADAFASYKAWRSWYSRWPDRQVRTPRAYARVWGELATSFLGLEQRLDSHLVRYEDLVADSPAIGGLEAFLGAPVDRGVLARRIGGSAGRARTLTRLERRRLRAGLDGAERRFGYRAAP
jgi:Sulfotransferase family